MCRVPFQPRNHPSLDASEKLRQLREIRRTQARHGIPSARSLEPRSIATRVATLGDIIENLRVRVKNRVNKADGGFSSLQTLLVDEREHGAPDGRGQGRAADEVPLAAAEDELAVADGADVRVRAAEPIVHALAGDGGEVPVARELAVAREGEGLAHGLDVRLHVRRLPQRDGEDVAEAAAAREAGGSNLVEFLEGFGRRGVGKPVPLRAADGEDVRAGAREVRVEDLGAVGLGGAGAVVADARVPRRDHRRGALERELEPLGALPPHVVVGEVRLAAAVRDRDHVRRLVHAALQLARVPARVRVRVGRVLALGLVAVALLAEGRVVAVRPVDGVEERVPEACEVARVLVVLVVRLEEDRALGPDQGPG